MGGGLLEVTAHKSLLEIFKRGARGTDSLSSLDLGLFTSSFLSYKFISLID